MRIAVKTAGSDRFLDRENRRERFVFDDHLRRGLAAKFRRGADDERDDVPMIQDLFVREQNFIVPNGADVVQAGNVFGEENRADAWHESRVSRIAPQDFRMRMRRTNGPDLEHVLLLSIVIHVNGLAGYMLMRALVREGRFAGRKQFWDMRKHVPPEGRASARP